MHCVTNAFRSWVGADRAAVEQMFYSCSGRCVLPAFDLLGAAPHCGVAVQDTVTIFSYASPNTAHSVAHFSKLL
jgi:hypothetical protein